MAKVRKVNYDPNKVESGGNFVHHPAPAIVRVKCTDADLAFKSSSGNEGVHLQFKIIGSKPAKKDQQWSTLHHYLTFTEAAQWREVEMMEALIGKRVKTYKDSDLVGKICLAKLRPEDYEGETQAKIARLMSLEDEIDDEDGYEDEDEDEDTDDDNGDDDEDEPEDDYNDWSLPQLRAELESRDLEKSGRKPALVKRLEENDAGGDEDEDDDEPEDDDDNSDDGTIDLETMSLRELRALAKENGVATRGLDKDGLIEALESNEDDDEDEDDDDDEDAEPDVDYTEWSLKDLRAEAKERGINTRGLDKDALAEAIAEDEGDPFADDDE